MSIQESALIENYSSSLSAGQAALFIGAGMSVQSGIVNWKELLSKPAKQIGLKADEVTDLPRLAEYCARKLGKNVLIQHIMDNLCTDIRPTENHRILAQLPVRVIWTTNYDNLLEKAFEETKIQIEVRRRDTDFMSSNPHAKIYINKMHGDIDAREEIIITSSDYEKYPHSHHLMATKFLDAATDSTLLFLGVGFIDPNFSHIMGELASRFGTRVRTHYAIMLTPDKSKLNEFNLFVEDLERYGIRVVAVNTPEDITRILGAILSMCDNNKEYEILVGQDERNKYLVKNLELIVQRNESTPPKIRLCQVFSSFAISNEPEYIQMEPSTNIDDHMAMLMREHSAFEALVSERGAHLDLMLCPPANFQPKHEVRYRNILEWLKTHAKMSNIRVKCTKIDFFTNKIIVENNFSMLANYNPRSGYDENRVYKSSKILSEHVKAFDDFFKNAEYAGDIHETIEFYESMLKKFQHRDNVKGALLSSEIKHKWMQFELKMDVAIIPVLGEIRYTYMNHPGSVLIIPILPSGKLLLVEQYRYLMGSFSIEFPSGSLEKSDLTKSLGAIRELKEETGYVSTQWEQIGEFYTSNGSSNEVMTVFIAKDIKHAENHREHPDAQEKITVKILDMEEVQQLIRDGTIKDAPTITALQFFKEHNLNE